MWRQDTKDKNRWCRINNKKYLVAWNTFCAAERETSSESSRSFWELIEWNRASERKRRIRRDIEVECIRPRERGEGWRQRARLGEGQTGLTTSGNTTNRTTYHYNMHIPYPATG